jgi:DNA-binding CsgD family transcriptional regulator
MGPVELQLGMAFSALGRLEEAVAELEHAVSICDAAGAFGCAVQARVELAAVLRRRQAPGDPARARILLDSAAGEAERLGMVPFSERIALLRAAEDWAAASAGSGAAPASAAAAAPALSPLSPRELEVARLVARGQTNRQIAETLVVSERTAENHVQHILVKLGFSNRSQIAAWVPRE